MNSIDEYKIPYGIMAEFENAADTMHAAEKIRDEGYTI